MKKGQQEGFTYIEVMCAMVILLIGILAQLSALSYSVLRQRGKLCAMVILLIGILAQLSALSYSVLRQREAEQQNTARQIANSTLESIFAARDLGKSAGISSWEMINTSDTNENGIFVPGWNPVRQNAGKDGIQGTRDDACAAGAVCQADNYSNTSALIQGFDRKIIITDIDDSDSSVVKKRRLEVRMRYMVGQAHREQVVATVIADLPFYK